MLIEEMDMMLMFSQKKKVFLGHDFAPNPLPISPIFFRNIVALFHSLFRIASLLETVNPHWDEETLYQVQY